ncbi:MAG TPA: cytochrome d ubiquinol oxidase subunit II [Rhizomicrobium sp.]
MDATVFFAAVTAFAVVVYVLADGFDLGVGILFLLAPSESDRDTMMQSVEPVWDGNETWLVMGGMLLYVGFPAGYYILMPAFYLPVMLMLFALVFRGIAFAFRFQGLRLRRVWDFAFAGGSLCATLAQGLILGGVIAGVPVAGDAFAGGPLAFLNVEGILCGAGLAAGYSLLGAGWLVWKTEGSAQSFGRTAGRAALILTAAAMAAVSGWTALAHGDIAARWFGWPNIAFLAPVPLLTAGVVVALWRALRGSRDARPFVLAVALFLLGFAGLVVSLWPYVVRPVLTIWDAASDPGTQIFAGIGIAIIMPIVLAYQAHAYWVFRGKTLPEADGAYGSTQP